MRPLEPVPTKVAFTVFSRIVHGAFLNLAYSADMKSFLSAVAAATLGLSLSIAFPISASASPSPQLVTINASSEAMFSPSEITVHAGQPVELKFVGKSGVHGIQSSALGIPATTITPGSTQTVTFTPSKVGTYTLNCTIPCGPNHSKMMIVVKVI
jgi:cytochrome c oxidase subunit II